MTATTVNFYLASEVLEKEKAFASKCIGRRKSELCPENGKKKEK